MLGDLEEDDVEEEEEEPEDGGTAWAVEEEVARPPPPPPPRDPPRCGWAAGDPCQVQRSSGEWVDAEVMRLYYECTGAGWQIAVRFDDEEGVPQRKIVAVRDAEQHLRRRRRPPPATPDDAMPPAKRQKTAPSTPQFAPPPPGQGRLPLPPRPLPSPATTPLVATPPPRPQATQDVIDIDTEAADEAAVDKAARALARREYGAGRALAQPVPLEAFAFRAWASPATQAAPGAPWAPPPTDKMVFIDTPMKRTLFEVWSQRVDGGELHVVLDPGGGREVCLPVSDFVCATGAADDGDVYLHLTSTHCALKDVLTHAVVNDARLGARPAGCDPSVALPATAREKPTTGWIHIAMLCRAGRGRGEFSAAKERAYRVRSKAHYFMLSRAWAARGAPLDATAAELAWARAAEAEVRGECGELLRYSEESALDKGTLVVGDYNRLGPGRFLNDALINFTLHHVARPDACVFPTLFLTRFRGAVDGDASPQRLRDWAAHPAHLPAALSGGGGGAQRSITAFRVLIVPVHLPKEQHWALGVVSMQPEGGRPAPAFYYMDSLGKPDPSGFLNAMPRFVAHRLGAEETLREKGCLAEEEGTALAASVSDPASLVDAAPRETLSVPRQVNGHDCGVHVLIMAEAVMNSQARAACGGFDPASAPMKKRAALKQVLYQMAPSADRSKLDHFDRKHQIEEKKKAGASQ